MQRDFGIISDCIRGLDEADALDYIHDAGFTAFFSSEHSTDMQSVAKIRKKADALGLRYEFLHAPYQGVNGMWTDEEHSYPFLKRVLESIDSASENGVLYHIADFLEVGWRIVCGRSSSRIGKIFRNDADSRIIFFSDII